MPPRRQQPIKSEVNDNNTSSSTTSTTPIENTSPLTPSSDTSSPQSGADANASGSGGIQVKPKAPPPRRRVKEQNEDIIGGPQLKARREPRGPIKQEQTQQNMRVAFRGLSRDGSMASNARKQQIMNELDFGEKSELDQMLDIDTNLSDFSDNQFNTGRKSSHGSNYKPVNLPFVSPSAPEWYESWLDDIPDTVILPAFLDPSIPQHLSRSNISSRGSNRSSTPISMQLVKPDPSVYAVEAPVDLAHYHIPQIHSTAAWFLPDTYLSDHGIDLTPQLPPSSTFAGQTDSTTTTTTTTTTTGGDHPIKQELTTDIQYNPLDHHVFDPTHHLYLAKDVLPNDSKLVLLQLPPYLNLADTLKQNQLQQQQYHQQQQQQQGDLLGGGNSDIPLTTSSILASSNAIQTTEENDMYRNPHVTFYNANGSTIKAQDARDLGYLPRYYELTAEGQIGKLSIYASGRVVLTINNTQYEISKGADINMRNDAILIEPNQQYNVEEIERYNHDHQQYLQQQQQHLHDPLLPQPEPIDPLAPEVSRPLVATFLGPVTRHAVCTIDVDHMFASHTLQSSESTSLDAQVPPPNSTSMPS